MCMSSKCILFGRFWHVGGLSCSELVTILVIWTLSGNGKEWVTWTISSYLIYWGFNSTSKLNIRHKLKKKTASGFFRDAQSIFNIEEFPSISNLRSKRLKSEQCCLSQLKIKSQGPNLCWTLVISISTTFKACCRTCLLNLKHIDKPSPSVIQ